MDETSLSPVLALVGIKSIAEQINALANLYGTPQQKLSQTLQVFGDQMRTLQLIAYPTQGALDALIGAMPTINTATFAQLATLGTLNNFDALAKAVYSLPKIDLGMESVMKSFISSLEKLSFTPALNASIGLPLSGLSHSMIFNDIAKLSTLFTSETFSSVQSSFDQKFLNIEEAIENFLWRKQNEDEQCRIGGWRNDNLN